MAVTKLTIRRVQPNWSQSVVLPGTSQSCFFILGDLSEAARYMDDTDSCNDSVLWNSVTYEWTFEIASSGDPFLAF